MVDPDKHRTDMLERIATLLQCTQAQLREGVDLSGPAADASELLRLWSAIDDPEGRRQVLALARRLTALQ